MNRPYLDVQDTVYVQCSVCNRRLLYTSKAINAHETRCKLPASFDPSAVVGRIVPAPPR